MAVIDWWNGPLTLVVIFFALCLLLLLTWSIADVACRACHSSSTFFHCDTHTHTHTQLYLSSFSDTHHTHTHTHTHTWVSKVFVSTDARRPYSRGVIRSTVGTYPRGTGSNPVEGNGHFFPSYRQLYLSSFSDTHERAHVRSHISPKWVCHHPVFAAPTHNSLHSFLTQPEVAPLFLLYKVHCQLQSVGTKTFPYFRVCWTGYETQQLADR